MKTLLWINHVLIAFFAVSSGIFKLGGGQADLDVFAHLGMGPTQVAVFGAVQALGGIGLLFARTCRPGAIVVILANSLATIGLFAAGVHPFSIISILFIAMALLELRLDRERTMARPLVAV